MMHGFQVSFMGAFLQVSALTSVRRLIASLLPFSNSLRAQLFLFIPNRLPQAGQPSRSTHVHLQPPMPELLLA